MSRKGNCWDNAVVESFFSTMKRELDDPIFASREMLAQPVSSSTSKSGTIETVATRRSVTSAPSSSNEIRLHKLRVHETGAIPEPRRALGGDPRVNCALPPISVPAIPMS